MYIHAHIIYVYTYTQYIYMIMYILFILFLLFNRSEIDYLMQVADTNKDGLLDYKEFTERFHQPAHNLGSIEYRYLNTRTNSSLLISCVLIHYN